MLSYSDYFSDIYSKNTYFAGANTPSGFKCEYQNLISRDSFDKVYIVKGGAGSGKSTLIKKCMESAKERGADCMEIRCSSDPDSLDGVIIGTKNKKIAVIDGTAPHIEDPIYPGAVGEIVDSGLCWRTDALEENRASIIELSKKKKKVYERAYGFLRASGEIAELHKALADHYYNCEKLSKAAERLVKALPFAKSEEGKVSLRRTLCVSMKGAYRLTSFEKEKTLWAVEDCAFLSPIFYSFVARELVKRGFDINISLSPIYGICEIEILGAGVAIVPKREGRSYEKIINLRRFADNEKMGEVKQKRFFSSKCYSEMLSGALESLRDAGKFHFELEEIYKSAMDFEKLDRLSEGLCEKIKNRL